MSNLEYYLLTLLIMFCYLLSLNSILEDAVDEWTVSVKLQLLAKPRQMKPPDIGLFILPVKNECADRLKQRRHEQGYERVQLKLKHEEPELNHNHKPNHNHNHKPLLSQSVLVVEPTSSALQIFIVRLFESMQIIIYPIMLEQGLMIL